MVRVACLQMNSGPKVAENLRFIDRHLSLASDQGVELVQLPENFAQMPADSTGQMVEDMGHGEVQSFLQSTAKKYQLAIVAGALPIKASSGGNAKPFSRCLVFDQHGRVACGYDKVHLFDVNLPDGETYRESDRYSAATNPPGNIVVKEVVGVQLGLSICYDLRFPELYRLMVAEGVQLISVPSAFTYQTGQAHWRTLLTARAIENLSYVFAAAQTGIHANGRCTWGHSMIISPWGEILAQADEQPGLISANIDLIKLDELRARFPALKHRRV